MAEDEDGDIEFELGMSWLPAQVLDEACGDPVYKDLHEKSSRRQRQHHHTRIKGEPLFQQSHRSRVQDRARSSNNRVTGGPGMRAIFLETGNGSCGTGVFLPRRDGDYLDTSRKPACSPILLPFHVIEALNLNSRTFGSQISSRRVRSRYEV